MEKRNFSGKIILKLTGAVLALVYFGFCLYAAGGLEPLKKKGLQTVLECYDMDKFAWQKTGRQ